jgi:hypothetical protein
MELDWGVSLSLAALHGLPMQFFQLLVLLKKSTNFQTPLPHPFPKPILQHRPTHKSHPPFLPQIKQGMQDGDSATCILDRLFHEEGGDWAWSQGFGLLGREREVGRGVGKEEDDGLDWAWEHV